ncbi:hypothetical protein LTR56_007919 [Elasticomyces elasticus]|nr:hypothetical protein LTR56_007919 [Elasticomyces elasticus]KAK4908107.1 hypothetical protein LTR49_022941 [Elasticomyces elasticus]KAK4973056.1 hypothetical protein LTR42_006350 [Elasticomyces elasticus]
MVVRLPAPIYHSIGLLKSLHRPDQIYYHGTRLVKSTGYMLKQQFKLGRITHYAFDAVLLSAFLAGVRRSTGLTLKPETISESPTFTRWFERYLWVGETIMDQSVAVMGSSGYFERKR